MNNKTNNSSNNNSSNNINNNGTDCDLSPQSTPTRSLQDREIEQRRHHILLLKSNKMLKRCCCYMLILCLAVVLLPPPSAAVAVGDALVVVTTDAPPPKRVANSAEILQLPHAFRHEEHYSHRIEQAVNDFKRAQLQQLKERDKNLTTEAPPLSRPAFNGNGGGDSSSNKNRNDLFQWQMEPHHRRHEQHYLQQNQQHSHPQSQPPTEHHLRHSNGRLKNWEENNAALPPMRHQRHQMQQQQQQHRSPPLANKVVSGFDGFNADNKTPSNQRFSFQLKTDNFDQKRDDSSAYGDSASDEADAAADNNDDSADSSDESDGEYSYEDENSDESTFGNTFPRSSNSYSAVDGKAASVKRYTNPFKFPFKASFAAGNGRKRWSLLDQRRESNKNKLEKIDDDSNSSNDSNNDDDDDDNNGENGRDDDSATFTNEKWHKIESEHHRRQLQHQREMQALRLRHNPSPVGLDTTPRMPHERRLKNEEPIDAESIFSRNYIPGTLTRHKIEELGTAEAVKETRRTHATKHKKNRELASAHVKQIISEAACRVPQRRVERIQLDPAKTYTPHCTILHRCADDTGCCRSERQTCAPKHTQNVDLYFFVKDLKEKRPTIERLTFINHTECHCVDRAPRQPDEFHNGLSSFNSAGHEMTLRRATILNCNCPRLFEKILQEDGYCRCDCSSGNMGCDWLKRGMEHFAMMERKCMLEGRCKPPTCEYGTYLKKHGRCPRREEQLAYTLSGNSEGTSSALSSSAALTTNSLH